jgi:hypothetical protein
MSTVTSYTAHDASEAARTAADRRLERLQDELADEHEEAVALAVEYADHLATDGDPTDYPKHDDRDRHHHGLARVAREAVFDTWNESRTRRSISYPWGPDMPYQWIVQEYLLDRVGEPVPMDKLARLHRVRKASPAQVAEAAWSVQVATRGELRVRKVRVDGKVAWLVRLPVEADALGDIACREGVWGDGSSLDQAEVLEALGRPFKSRVFEYPEERL